MLRTPDAESLLDLTREKLVVLDEAGKYTYLNAATRDVLGFDPETLVGTDAFDLVHPEDEARIRAAFEELDEGQGGGTETLEYRYETAGGDWLWLRSQIYAPSETEMDGYVVSSRDVTEEVESIRRLETIVSTSTDVLWMFDADWSELLFVSDTVDEVFGLSRATLERDPRAFLNRVYPADRPNVERKMRQLSDGHSTTLEYRVEPDGGEVRWVRVPGEPVREDGEVVAVAGFARDITDEYRHKRQLEVMDNLLRHTIRNDMNVVIGTAERILEATETAEPIRTAEANEAGRNGADRNEAKRNEAGRNGAERNEAERNGASGDGTVGGETVDVEAAARTVRRVADDLLDTAEKQRDVIELLSRGGSPQSIDVEPIVRELVGEMRTERPAGEFSVSCPSDVTAFALPELEYAVAELIRNAVEHADTTPAVEVDVTRTDSEVRITIRDNCPVIPIEERQIIADRWEMDDLRHTAGMGLWLAYWVAERSDGGLAFDTVDDGNIVTIHVPREEHPEENDPPGLASDMETDSPSGN